MRQARREPGLDRVAANPYDRCRIGRRADRFCDGVVCSNDRVRLSIDDLTRQLGVALRPSLTGIPINGEVLSLDIAQPAQLRKKRLPGTSPLATDAGDGA